MLKNIPPILSPELLKVLCEMGHGDEIILADGNFPAESIGKDAIVIRADGHGTVELLEAILQFLPLDQYVEKPVALMKVVAGDPCKPCSSFARSVFPAAPAGVPARHGREPGRRPWPAWARSRAGPRRRWPLPCRPRAASGRSAPRYRPRSC